MVVGVDMVGKGNCNETKQHGNGRGLQNKPPKTHEEKIGRAHV